MRCLVTGGAGFIGSHLCETLLKKGEVICLDNLVTGDLKNIKHLLKNPRFQFLKHDITKPLPIKVCSARFTHILNLACPASPVDYQKFPLETMLVSSIGTQNMLELAKKHQVVFLHTSTSEVYGDPKEHPQKETYWGNVNPYGPRACYDESKRYAEALIWTYHHKYKVKTKIVRIFNTYGPRIRPCDGRVISNFIRQALTGENLTVYGTGEQTRSFCYISDMIEGIIKMLESYEVGPINLGNSSEFKIIDLTKKVLALTQSHSRIIFKPLPPDDPVQRRPDITLAKAKLSWQPQVSLEEGLQQTIAWFKKEIK